MRKPRAFRPTADPLETRMVPSSVTVAMRAAQLANFHPNLQLNTPFAHAFGAPGGVSGGFISATRATTAATNRNLGNLGAGSLLAGRGGPFGVPFSSLVNATTIRTSTGVANVARLGTGTGLTFSNATPGAISGLTFSNSVPGAISGLTFANSLVSTAQNNSTFLPGSAFSGINGFSFNNGNGMFGF